MEFQDQPVVFLEDDVDWPLGDRQSRWWTAHTSTGTVYLPLVMASSGYRISSGNQDFKSVYRTMVQAELARPPKGEIEAFSRREGNTMRTWVRVENGSTSTLWARTNQATIHALVWENARLGVTSRRVRAAPYAALVSPVSPGQAVEAVLTTPNLSSVDWSKLQALALLDYRPGGTVGPFDMLQAGLARAADLYAEPSELVLGAEGQTSATVNLSGPHTLQWTVSSDVLWLSVTPGAGRVPAQATVTLLPEQLPSGMQEGHVSFAATSLDGLSFTATVTVRAVGPPSPWRLRRRLFASPGPTAAPARRVSPTPPG